MKKEKKKKKCVKIKLFYAKPPVTSMVYNIKLLTSNPHIQEAGAITKCSCFKMT